VTGPGGASARACIPRCDDSEAVKSKLVPNGMEPLKLPAADYQKQINDEIALNRDIVKKLNIKGN